MSQPEAILNVIYGTWHRLDRGGVATLCGKDTSLRLADWHVAAAMPPDAYTRCTRCENAHRPSQRPGLTPPFRR